MERVPKVPTAFARSARACLASAAVLASLGLLWAGVIELVASRSARDRKSPRPPPASRLLACGPEVPTETSAADPVPEVEPVDPSPPRESHAGPPPLPPAGPVAVGSTVAIVGRTAFASRGALDEVRRGLRGVGSLEPGRDVFSASPWDRAEVAEAAGPLVRVRMLGGRWGGREGWLAAADVRPASSSAGPEPDAVDGLTEVERRGIYREVRAARAAAGEAADRKFPSLDVPFDPDRAARYLAGRSAAYDAAKRGLLRRILAEHRLSASALSRIEHDGDERGWPASAGPSPR